MKLKLGDKVKVITKDKEYIGIYVPSPSKNIFVLKLDSGYNLGISKTKIKSVRLIKKSKEKKFKKEKIKFKKKLPTVLILHTGGTIASRVSYETGAVISRFKPEELISMFPELKKIANIKSKLIFQIFSEDIRFSHYNKIAKEISKNLNVKGIIVTHGTDTLHYTASALAFILENIPIPVILVGAQRSSDRGSTDAYLNLISAAYFIAKTDFTGVAICMHSSINDETCYILPACKTRKLHTSRRDAFKAINDSPIAEIKNSEIKFFKRHNKPKEKFKLRLLKENLKIGILKAHPNMYAKEIDNYKNFDGLILEGTGLGHFPINQIDTKENQRIYNKLKQLAKKIPIVMTSQCLFGSLNMNVYATGRKLQDIGIIGNYTDILPETAFIKLAFLLSHYKKDIKKLWNKNLRGEINKRILPEQYLE